VVNQWTTSLSYTTDNILSIIRGVSTHSRPAIDPRRQLGLQSAKAVDSADILDIEKLQLQVIIPNYSYISIQGKYLQAEDIMTYIQLLRTCDSYCVYVGAYLFEQLQDIHYFWQSELINCRQSMVQYIPNE
jgi:hypothetical protein